MGGFNLDRLRDVSLAISKLTCDCRVWKSPRNRRVGGLIVFRGHYPPGSAGKDDALWIKWRLDEFYELTRFDGLVVDCRELDYTWGDDLHLRPRARELPDDFPFLLVIAPEQQEAFAYTEPRDYHRFELLTALAELDERLRGLSG
jgi:hypothetical protein